MKGLEKENHKQKHQFRSYYCGSVSRLSHAELYGMRIEIIVVNALIKPKSNYRGEVEVGGSVGEGFGVLWWGEVKIVNYER